tara:strand:+ start:2503 stop:3288 length:786 start_codon:yes stop_codon:yes gene_type:complete
MKEYFSLNNELVNNRYNLVIENFDMLIGPKGDIGDRGYTGVKGPQGIEGDRGYDGPIGDVGLQGPQGYRGLEGIIGDKGEKGKDGERGPVGFQGFRGQRGLMGEQGLKGDKGKIGDQGYEGRQGFQGIKGDRGPMGETILTEVLIENDYQTDGIDMTGFEDNVGLVRLQSSMIDPINGNTVNLSGKNKNSLNALCPYNGYLNTFRFTTKNLQPAYRTSPNERVKRVNINDVDFDTQNILGEQGMPYKFRVGCKKIINNIIK